MSTTETLTTHRGRTPFVQAAGLVAQREITTKIRSKAFMISTLLFIVGIFASVLLGNLAPQLFDRDTSVAVTAETQSALANAEGFELELFQSESEVREAVESEAVSAGILANEGPTGYLVIADREAPGSVIQALSVVPELELLDPDAPNPLLVYFIGFAFGLVFFVSAMTFGSTIAQSVVEEKQSRIVEIMLAAISARSILAGKVIGNTLLAFAQVVLCAAAVLLAGAVTGSEILLDGLGMPIVWFVLFFTVGFVMLAALYAAAAALVSRTEDLGATSSPIMMLIMLPYFAVIAFNNNPAVLQVMSYVPFSAPVAVPMRVYLGTLEWWEPLLSLAILVATTVAVLLLAASIYERSLLKTGAAVKWRNALKR